MNPSREIHKKVQEGINLELQEMYDVVNITEIASEVRTPVHVAIAHEVILEIESEILNSLGEETA